MAPLGSPDSPQSRFSGFCSSSMAPSPAPTGFAFDVPPHLHRLVQSSASSNEDTAFQIQQQVTQYYLQRRQQASQNGVSTPPIDIHRVTDDADNMEAELPKQDPQLGQALQLVMQENLSAGIPPSLMRYNSAPSSMLASLTGMGNAILKGDVERGAERGQFLSHNDLHLEAKNLMDTSHEPLLIESRGAAGEASGAPVDNLSNHRSGLLSSYAPYRHAFDNNNGELLSQMGMDVEGTPLIRASDGLPEAGRAALDVPSSYHLRGAFPNSTHFENGNGIVHGVAASKNCLLRHSSSPAGFFSQQLNDEHERHMLPGSSSGNSSEEGSYERQGGQGFLGKFSWDEAGNAVIGSPNASYAARKRIRDLEEKGYALMDSQKGDALEHGVLGNYFGLPATSPENTYFTDKLSPDSIPCRTRAKRGCATHPRSIAERVRRTKISERMKKLQDLVPNMDKQTNTAEMLDEAVEYVKELQRRVQELTESRSKCDCSCRLKETSSK